MRRLRYLLLPLLAILLSGCNFVVLAPAGDVAAQQRDLLVVSTLLMLLIILPVMALTALFAWRYRASNTKATYAPDWDHSTKLELVIWSAPLLIIICLGALTWLGTHLLDPYRQLGRINANQAVAADQTPLKVEVVALDWKWLFIYPDYGIATVNDMAAPVDRPIDFSITASSVMNAFYVPALAGMIYAMPGMETRLNAVVNDPGTYSGFSANYSGAGFSGMHFAFHGMSPENFDKWIAEAKSSGETLDRPGYLSLAQPSENVPVRRYASVDPELYGAILNRCVEKGTMCMSDMASIDAKGGLGLAGVNNVLPLEYGAFARRGAVFGRQPTAVASICSTDDAIAASVARLARQEQPAPRDLTPLRGLGLPLPGLPQSLSMSLPDGRTPAASAPRAKSSSDS